MRPGEELDWAALERHLRQRLPHLAGRLLGAAVPERLGQPDLPGPVRRRRAGRPAAAVRRHRGRGPRHAPRVHRAVAAARGVPTRPAGPALLRRPGGHRRPLPGLGVPPRCRGLGPRAGRARGRGAPGAASASPWSTRWPTCTSSTPRAATSATSAAPTATWTGSSGGWRRRWEAVATESAAHGGPGRRAARPAPAGVRPARPGAQRLQGRQLPVRAGRPRPRDLGLRLGHGDARRPAHRPRDAAELLARRRRPPPRASRESRTSGCPAATRSSSATPRGPGSG